MPNPRSSRRRRRKEEEEEEESTMAAEGEAESTMAVRFREAESRTAADPTIKSAWERMIAAPCEAESAEGEEEESMKSSSEEEEEESTMSSSEEVEVEVEAEGKWNWDCIVRDCVCYWRCFGSPRTPRVAPGKDYSCIPTDADHTPTWSLLVGFMQGSVLALKRLRVARSGRILGRSDDALDFFRDVDMPAGCDFSVSAALDPDDRSLCLLRQAWNDKPQALQLSLLPQTTDAQELPEFGETSRCILISSGGNIWALSVAAEELGYDFTVLMRLLVPGHGWNTIGSPFTSPCLRDLGRSVPGSWFLQGYAVLADAKLILVSFKQNGLFLTFATDSGHWAPVLTEATRSTEYVPIPGRGVYVEQDQAIYMLRDNTIYAYKLAYQQDDQGRLQLGRLDPPVEIDSVCPFNSCKGYGLLTCIDAQLMCSVWISLPWREPCLCGNLHVIVTTFYLRDPAQGGIQVLHSSFRRINMQPNPEDQEFCFLLEYEDEDSTLLLRHEEEKKHPTSSQHVDDPSKMLDCCRQHLMQENDPRACFLCGGEGHIARDCSLPAQERSSAIPPWGQARSMLVDPALMQRQVSFSSRPVAPLKPATTTIKQKMFIICQIDSRSFVYKTGIVGERLLLEGDDGDPLVPLLAADDGDDSWHFIYSGSKLEAVSSTRDSMLEFSLDDKMTYKKPARRPTADPFIMVIRVGREIIALTDTLQVFHQTSLHNGSPSWLRYKTDDSLVFCRKVVILGYVALNDRSFIVWDAVTCSCLLFDLGAKQWRVVMPWAAFEDGLPRASLTNSILNDRCVFVDGFIYTCSYRGLVAYQLLHKDHSVYLSKPIFLAFSWLVDCESDDVSLDYAGKDDSGALLFYVVQAGYSRTEHEDVEIYIVQVKTKKRPSKKMKPVRVDLVDRITRPIRHKQGSFFCTRRCFAF